MRGEKITSLRTSLSMLGSPPHTRGKVPPDFFRTPQRLGSPPHTRGKGRRGPGNDHAGRITPAYAGKRRFARRPPVPGWDHPRIRGEKLKIFLDGVNLGGSPPHTRGKGKLTSRKFWTARITPACAGKSRSGLCPGRKQKDHPRMRGDKPAFCNDLTVLTGSPPHARGKAHSGSPDDFRCRITPACAGKRHRPCPSPAQRPDHPRMRGEKSISPFPSPSLAGSPPHARGKDLESPEKSTFLLCRTSDFI